MFQRLLLLAVSMFILLPLAQAENPLENLPDIKENEIRIYLIRHAETFHNIDHTMESNSPEYYRITLRGKKQAEELGKLLVGKPIAAIFTSQMTRTKETLKFMAMPKEIPVVDDKAFNFMKLGVKEDGSDATMADRIALWNKNTDSTPPNGESLSDATRRAIARLRAENALGKAVVVISHGDVIAGLIGSAEGLNTWDRWEEAQVPVGSISVIDIQNEGPLYVHVKGYDPVE